MKICLLAVLTATLLMSGCGGAKVQYVRPETTDDLARCGMGLSSSTQANLAASIEKNGGKVDAKISDEIKAVFADKFGEKDALAAQAAFTACMDKQSADRKAAKKEASVQACTAARLCDRDFAIGFCMCIKTADAAKEKYGWTEAQTLKAKRENCNLTNMCWPAASRDKDRAACDVVLQGAPYPTFNEQTCKVDS